MQRAAVVPDQQVADAPRVPVAEFWPCDVAVDLGDEALALRLRPVDDVRDVRAEVQRQPPLQEGAVTRLRDSLPLMELRVPFEVSRDELEAVGRGARDADLDSVRNAARAAGIAEDRAVFQGYRPAGIVGMFEASASQSLSIPENYEAYPDVVAEATHRLRSEGVNGPYGIALGPRCYTGLTRSTTRGYPVINHVRELLNGPIVWAPAADGAVVMSLRGGDFELTVGQDFSVGYLDHTSTSVLLYLQETFTFRVLTPEASVPLTYPAAKVGKSA